MRKKILKIPKPPKQPDFKKIVWDEFSLYVRERDHFKCQVAEKCREKKIAVPSRCGGAMQACHNISRSKKRLLYDSRNVHCGCEGHNAWAHFNPLEWEKLWRRLWPEDVTYLDLVRSTSSKPTKLDLKLILIETRMLRKNLKTKELR